MKRTIFTVAMFLSALAVQGQTCPTPTTTGAYVTMDPTYQLGSYTQGKTNIGLCWNNSTNDKLTASQFRVFYDANAFAGVDTITMSNTSFASYLQYSDNPTLGYVTITMTYTGTDPNFTLPNGAMFNVTLNHKPALSTTYLSPLAMTFVGTTPFSQLATTQSGNDYTLSLQNFGGVFLPQTFSYRGRFLNVTGTGSKNIPVVLEKSLKNTSTWVSVDTSTSGLDGRWAFTNVSVDTSAWNVRINVKGDTLGYGNIVTTSDAQQVNKFVLGTQSPSGFDFYTSDVNGDNSVSVSDVYSIFARVSGRFNSWVNSVKDVLFFTDSEYTTINGSSTNFRSTIPGQTNFTKLIGNNEPDSVTYYVASPGDVNGTGFKMARMIPIEIVNPNNANQYIIDVTTHYDMDLESIEVNFPTLGVNEGDLVSIPVKLKTGTIELGSLQVAMKYDSDLLEFVELTNELKPGNWVSFINTSDNVVEWGGYDPSNNLNLIQDGEIFFTLQFRAKTAQINWNKSPLYVTRKFAGNRNSKDLKITPTDGILQIFKTDNGFEYDDMMLFPNPTKGETTLKFKIFEPGYVTLGVYDLNGRLQIDVLNGKYDVGEYSRTIDLGYLSTGEYLAVLQNEKKLFRKKILKVK
jgi:hypothetical protein